MAFKIGQKVVCVDDAISTESLKIMIEYYKYKRLRKGKTYTVRGYSEDCAENILLEEYVNPPARFEDGTCGEAGYGKFRFRPLITSEQPGTLTIEQVLTEVEQCYQTV